MKKTEYIFATGNKDYQRLMLLSRYYNPGAIALMKKIGLKPGMKVLEIGCGTGHMAVDLAKAVGESGQVYATDNSFDQLEVAKRTVKEQGVNNIIFEHLDLTTDLGKYLNQFDFIYGRWVIEFTKTQAERVLKQLYQTLKPGGVFTYESVDVDDTGLFSYPDPFAAREYNRIGKMLWQINEMPIGFIKKAYLILQELNAQEVSLAPNQAILRTPEEKSIMRLGLSTGEDFWQGKISATEYAELIAGYEAFEKSHTIAGFYRNYIVSGKRP
jgi:ubiquinone/menaquinone biosynthesis C-methylase UbiE